MTMTDGQFIETGTLDLWNDTMQEQRARIEQLTAERDEALAMQNVAYAAGYYQSECGLPEHKNAVAALAELKALTAERDHAWAMVADADTRLGQSLADAVRDKADNARLREAVAPLIVIALDNLDGMDAETREECERDIAKARTALNTGKEVRPNGASKVPDNDIGPGDQGAVAGAALPTVDELAQIIRTVDGNHSLGAGELAERILEEIGQLQARVEDQAREIADLTRQLQGQPRRPQDVASHE